MPVIGFIRRLVCFWRGTDIYSDPPGERDKFDATVYRLRKSGKSVREIARILNCSPARVDRSIRRQVRTLAEALGLRHLSHDEMRARFFAYAYDALQIIIELSKSAVKEEVQLRAAVEVLDRAGFKPALTTLHDHPVEEMSRDELRASLEAIISRGEERAKPVGSRLPCDVPTENPATSNSSS